MVNLKVNLQQREIELLNDLYNMRLLSAGQIKRLYYKNSTYGYKRIRLLQEAGFLDSQPLISGTRKQTQYYYITEKGINQLNLDAPRAASKNKITLPHLVDRQLVINEIYVSLRLMDQMKGNENSWIWTDSRNVKEKYKYSRRDLIAGELESTITGERYAIYVITRKDSVTSNIKELCDSISKEIDRHDILRENIVLCPNNKQNTEIMQYFETKMTPKGNSLHVLPYPSGINIIYNALTARPQFLENLFKEVYGEECSKLTKSLYLHSNYETDNYYYAEMLTNDIVQRKYIEKYSTDTKYKKPLKIICWSFQIGLLKKRLRCGLQKIMLTPLSWVKSPIPQGITAEETYTNRTLRIQTVPITLYISIGVREYLKYNKTSKQRSALIEEILIATEDYKKYIAEISEN